MSAQPVMDDPASRVARARAALRRAEELTGARTLSMVSPSDTASPSRTAPSSATEAASPSSAASRPSVVPAHGPSAHPSLPALGPAAALTSDERPPLPVPAELAALVPGGLRRGSAAVVSGSTSLLLTLLAEVSQAGSWVAVVGAPGIGLLAVAEAGVDLDRLVLVPQPGVESATAVAALLDGMDVVVVGPRAVLLDTDRRRLTSRARERASVILATTPWPGAHLVLTAERSQWSGLGAGHGRLLSRRLTVTRTGRGSAGNRQQQEMWLPAARVPASVTHPAASRAPGTVSVPRTTGGARAVVSSAPRPPETPGPPHLERVG